MTVAVNKTFDSRVYELQFEPTTQEVESEVFEGKWFEGFAVGAFIDKLGRPLEVKREEMSLFFDNTREAIEASRAKGSGEIEGLPIDAKDHERGNAAGWIVDVALNITGDKLLFKPHWTVIGFELLKAKLMKGFSPTFSLEDMVIIGGTLTNWPATREDGIAILAPIELELSETSIADKVVARLSNLFQKTPENQEEFNTEGVTMTKNKVKIEDLTPEQVSELSTQLVADAIGGKGNGKVVDLEQYIESQIETRADAKIKVELLLAEKSNTIANFVKDITEGTEEDPNGIGVKPEVLNELLSSLDDDQLELAMTIIKAIKAGAVVNFEEQGTGDETTGKKELPKEIQTALDDGTLKVENLSMSSMGLGDIGEYNLSKWQKEGK